MISIEPTDVFLDDHSAVTYTDMGDICEVQYMSKKNTEARIRKLSKTQYLVLETGEIKDFELSETRDNNINSLRQTFKKLSYLINANFSGKKNELWVTLTYERNEQDLEVVRRDFDRFMKRFRRRYADKGKIEFIKVLEPQERGAWHMHMLVKFVDRKSIYIPNKFDDENNPLDAPLFEDWGQGWVNVQRPEQTDNIGAYVTAYLRDVLVHDATEEELKKYAFKKGVTDIESMDEFGETTKIKGGRLSMYPVGMNVFSKSKGMKYPERIETTYFELKKRGFSKDNLCLRRSLKIVDDENDFSSIIVIEQYNKKRSDSSNVLAKKEFLEEQLLLYKEKKKMGLPFLQWRLNQIEDELFSIKNKYRLEDLSYNELLKKTKRNSA